MRIRDLQKECYRVAVNKGWHEEEHKRSFGDYIALFHSELSEAFEEYRKGYPIHYIYYKEDKPEGIGIEMADLLIRVFDWAEAEGLDLENFINVKIAYNKTRPHRHGGKKV